MLDGIRKAHASARFVLERMNLDEAWSTVDFGGPRSVMDECMRGGEPRQGVLNFFPCAVSGRYIAAARRNRTCDRYSGSGQEQLPGI